MVQSSNFNAWDFANVWTITEGITNPLLRSFLTPLTITANDATKTYDGQGFSGGNGVTYSILPNGNLLGAVSYSGSSQGAIDVGEYGITPGGQYSVNQLGYVVTYTGANLAVMAAPLTVTADAQSRLYGAANPTLTYAMSGLVNGDALSGLLATAATTTSNVGNYGITLGTLANSNYSIAYTGANLAVMAPPLTVTPIPSYFSSNDLRCNGDNDNGLASVILAASPDASATTFAQISQSLIRTGVVALPARNTASCALVYPRIRGLPTESVLR